MQTLKLFKNISKNKKVVEIKSNLYNTEEISAKRRHAEENFSALNQKILKVDKKYKNILD